MGYIGKSHHSTSVPARTVSMLTGDGTTTTLTLSQAPMSASNVSVFFDGVAQTPGTDYTLSGSQLTFTSVPPAACVVCAIVGGGENISSPMDGSVTAESIVAGAITNAKISSVDASKLTGSVYPALDASNVTFGVQQNIFTKSAADPTETSNVTLGTIWVNTLSGEIFVCIDATTDQNSYMNVGTGTLSIFGNVTPGEPTDNVPDMTESTTMSHTFTGGTDTDGTITHYHVDQISDANVLSVADAEVAAGSPHVFTALPVSSDTDVTFRVRTKDDEGAYSNGITVTMVVTDFFRVYQGTQYGYNSNGYQNGVRVSSYERYSYPSGTPSNIVGDMTSDILSGTGHSSATHGYQAGWGTQIFKFSFATNGNATFVANMSVYHEAGGGASSEDNGYHLGGYAPGNAVSMIEKFSFQTDTSYGNIGSLTVHRYNITGHSSPTHGYATGGPAPTPVLVIDRVAFANDTVAVHVGNLSKAPYNKWADHSSLTHGFATGMTLSPTVTNIEKFAFSSSANSSDVGDLSAWTDGAVGTSETNNGYTSGGSDSGANKWTKIDKFSFASGGTATNVGNLAITRIYAAGQQV